MNWVSQKWALTAQEYPSKRRLIRDVAAARDLSVRFEDSNLLIILVCYTVLVIPVAMEETVCAKVPAELKKKLSSLGVNVSELIRETLQTEVDRLERERLNKLAKEVSEILKKIPPEEFTQSIRATRDSR